MGVGGSFWDLLKPYARHEGAGYLRGRRVAVDLSFWIVSHSTAIRARSPGARCPHLRNTFFRTLSLFSKMGAFPVFVVDGTPSPLKSQARAARFFRGSGLDLPPPLPSTDAEGEASAATPVKGRNAVFTRHVEECVELLEYLGMPVLRANGEAEALCAQLNNEGYVDACITSDSDAFLFGAKTVIKVLRSNCKVPFECYNIADIESGLELKRKQMVAMALLIGSDHDLHGVPGFGVETALRFVKLFDEDHVLDKLYEIGRGVYPFLEGSNMPHIDDLPSTSTKSSPIARPAHCSHCGHPGSKKNHSKDGCNYCLVESLENCMEKPAGFICECPGCDQARNLKEQRRHENWQIKVCKRIAAESNFPNEEIIKLYLSDKKLDKESGVLLNWNKPDVEALVDFLSYKQNWMPSYIRQRMLPMLSTIYLREMASSPSKAILYDQYVFHSIERIKIRYGHPYYLVKWERATRGMISNAESSKKPELEREREEVVFDGDEEEDTVICESTDLLDEPDIPQILTGDKHCFLLTDEDIQLVTAAFPNEARRFQEEQRLKEARSKARKSKLSLASNTSESPNGPKPSGVQLSIKEFFRSNKGPSNESGNKLHGDGLATKGGSRKSSSVDLSKNLSKSARRRLLFG